MIKNKEVIEKGAYLHFQAGSLVQVKNFIITGKTGKRCLLLQLVNVSEIMIDGVRLALIQLDSGGNVISKDVFTYNDVKIRPADSYAIESGLVLKDGCSDFRVQLVYALSGNYKYVFRNGQAVRYYDPRGYRTVKDGSSYDGKLRVYRRFERGRAVFRLITAVSVVVALAAVAYAAVEVLL